MNVPIISINLAKIVFESEHVPALFGGEHTHDPALRFVAQLVRGGADGEHMTQIVSAALPLDYSGDTLKELPEMIAGARHKSMDDPVAPQLGYQLTPRGLFLITKKQDIIIETFISGPFEIVGLVRDKESGGWARLLKWNDRDGHAHQHIASDKDLLSDHDLVCGELASGGLQIGKSKQAKLADFILSQDTTNRVTLVTQTGWHRIKTANIFALPRLILGSPPEPVVYEGADSAHNEFGSSGSLDDWKQEVAGPAGDHVLGALAISAALAAPLLHLAGIESGGIHLFGNSSTGKTTLLKCAASVWGDGGLVHSWRATANGLEGIANRTNDVVLILDELGQIDSKEASTAVYMLATGVGKIRMNRNATLKDIKTWRAFMLSSGEMTLEQKISQLRGATAFTGATLRLLNVSANREHGYGAFDHAGPTGNVGDMVKGLGVAATRYYGVAGVEFVKRLSPAPASRNSWRSSGRTSTSRPAASASAASNSRTARSRRSPRPTRDGATFRCRRRSRRRCSLGGCVARARTARSRECSHR